MLGILGDELRVALSLVGVDDVADLDVALKKTFAPIFG